MRAREFIEESKLRKSAVSSIPGAQQYPELDNSNPYHSYRFGVAMAGAPDFMADKDGPTGQHLVTIGYTSACDEITNAASKHLGFKSKKLTPKDSTEVDTTGKHSPVSNWLKPTKKEKSKKK